MDIRVTDVPMPIGKECFSCDTRAFMEQSTAEATNHSVHREEYVAKSVAGCLRRYSESRSLRKERPHPFQTPDSSDCGEHPHLRLHESSSRQSIEDDRRRPRPCPGRKTPGHHGSSDYMSGYSD